MSTFTVLKTVAALAGGIGADVGVHVASNAAVSGKVLTTAQKVCVGVATEALGAVAFNHTYDAIDKAPERIANVKKESELVAKIMVLQQKEINKIKKDYKDGKITKSEMKSRIAGVKRVWQEEAA